MRFKILDPQPSARPLPYSDPVNGLFWSIGGLLPHENKIDAPQWAHTCVQAGDLTANTVKLIAPECDDMRFCSGPWCPSGVNGCNAMGCRGTRDAFCESIGGENVWIWLEKKGEL